MEGRIGGGSGEREVEGAPYFPRSCVEGEEKLLLGEPITSSRDKGNAIRR